MSDTTTVRDYINQLRRFPLDWRVNVSTQAGGGISIEHREIGGEPIIAIFGSNGGRFGENPLTEEEYEKKSAEFSRGLKNGKIYTTIHGDHRLYSNFGGPSDSCYGTHYDDRVIARMVKEGILEYVKVPHSRDGVKISTRRPASAPEALSAS